jgi:flagellin-like hook-associated protein FlgL
VVSGLTAGASTTAQLTSNLQKVITQVVAAGTVSDFPSTLTATVDGTNTSKLDLSYTGNPITITPDASPSTTGEVAWSDGTDGASSENMATTNAAASAQDSVTVDSGFNVQYGVTSNAPGFQQVIAGLRLMNAAASQTDPTTYQTDMTQASSLLATGLSNIQSVHATVANNTNILKQETDLQNTDITNLQNQISNIQQVDLTSVGTQINLLQTQLQASYSATATLIQESILKYL